MVALMTLDGLESIARKKFNEQADEWVRAIARREGVGYDELRPHLVSLFRSTHRLEVVFIIPGHTAIQLNAWVTDSEQTAKVVGGKLGGDYDWFALRPHSNGSVSFSGTKGLGEALLLSRWAYDDDERAKWI